MKTVCVRKGYSAYTITILLSLDFLLLHSLKTSNCCSELHAYLVRIPHMAVLQEPPPYSVMS